MNRKQFLRTSGTLLAGSTLLPLAGCGSSPSDPKPKPPGNNYVNGAVALANVDDNGEVFKVSGTVTFPNGTTLPVADGLAQFGTQQQISPGRYRVQVLPAQEGDFPSHSDYITVREDHASIFEMVPKKIGSYSYNDFLDTFGYGYDENRHTRRWADNSVIISYHYDESHVLEDIEAAVGTFYRSNDPTKVASPYFIQNSIAALQEVVQMIPDSANIQINSFIESEGEIEFPRGYDYSEEGVIFTQAVRMLSIC
ncbi:hypothetical protein [Rhodohalobacter sulfatireducens]|uniref:Uncharacterized protein n=1 Tax=Rhodohalobacter sulfatireducens TaxID=2911366 RepID=A0ABS9K8C6_9BACT|nr:hypothetical protein [Rhodohalobacter sulfatireducens]MCG2587105.1 hypothetical protein [Rhodohalobacter sulfatireducens]